MLTLAVVGLGLLEVLCLWVPLSAASLTYDEALVLAGALGVLAAASLAPLVGALKRNSREIVAPLSILGLSNLLYGVLGNLMVFGEPEALLAGEQSLKYFGVAVIYLLLAFGAFAVGYRFPYGGGWVGSGGPWKIGRIPLAVAILVALGWGIRLYAMSQGLVITKLIETPVREILGNPILVALYFRSHALVWLAIAVCIIAAVRYSDGSRRTTVRWTLMATGLTGLEMLYFAVIALTRMQLFGLFLMIAVVLFLCGRSLPVRPLAMFLAVFVLFVMPFVAISKSIQSPILISSPDVFERFGMFVTDVVPATIEVMATDYIDSYVRTFGHSTHLSTADVLAAIVQKTWDEGIEPPGITGLLIQFAGLVPRALWPDKPDLETTMTLQNHYGYGHYGWGYHVDVVMTPFSEAYGFIGLPGALLIVALLGFLFKLIYRYLVGGSEGQWSTGVAVYGVLAFDMMFNQYTVTGVFAPLRDMILLLLLLSVVLEGRLPFMSARRATRVPPAPYRRVPVPSRSSS
jgi:hypothetical protein